MDTRSSSRSMIDSSVDLASLMDVTHRKASGNDDDVTSSFECPSTYE